MTSSKRLNITQSECNAHWALSWIKTQEAKDYMRSVMMATTVSRRHKLFLKKSERDQSSPLCLSQLYKLSNPGFIGEGGGVSDIKIIKELIENVFNVNFNDADTKLKQLGKNVAYIYTITVLFPETFIHYYQTITHILKSPLPKIKKKGGCKNITKLLSVRERKSNQTPYLVSYILSE